MAIRPRTLTSPPTAALPVAAPTAPPRTVAKRPARSARTPPIAASTARIVIPVGRVGMFVVPPRTVPGRTPGSGRSYSFERAADAKNPDRRCERVGRVRRVRRPSALEAGHHLLAEPAAAERGDGDHDAGGREPRVVGPNAAGA